MDTGCSIATFSWLGRQRKESGSCASTSPSHQLCPVFPLLLKIRHACPCPPPWRPSCQHASHFETGATLLMQPRADPLLNVLPDLAYDDSPQRNHQLRLRKTPGGSLRPPVVRSCCTESDLDSASVKRPLCSTGPLNRCVLLSLDARLLAENTPILT